MRRCLSMVVSLLLASLACSVPCWADEGLKSGPQPGESIPGPFHFLNINGGHAGNPHCLVCEYGLKPTVVVFAREGSEGNKALAILLQKLDEAVGKHKNARLCSFAAFLSEAFTKEETRKDLVSRLEKAAADLELKQLILTVDGPTGPEGYKVNKGAEITVLLYQDHRVIANLAFPKDKFGEKDVGVILDEVNKLVAPKK
jgi:hypothetical protein